MQAVFTSSAAFDPASRFHFAGGRDYMMRSEKRGSKVPSGSNTPGKRPPRRRRRKAGFFYKLLMLILLLVIWPVGLIMLWQRKLRWGVSTKLLTSVVTLGASILLIAFALTVNTGNPEYTAMQDKANDFLDVAADTLVDVGDIVAEKAEYVFAGASELGEALWEHGKLELADAIDSGIALTAKARTGLEGLVDQFMTWVESTGVPAAEKTTEPETTEEAIETTPEATAEPTPVPSARPIAEVKVQSGDSALPIYLPVEGEVIGEGRSLAEGMLQRNGVLEEGPLPTPVVTPEPTPEPLSFTVKPAAEAIVYYNDGGICYHMASSCGTMKSAKEHTLGETAELQHKNCNKCGSPNKALLEETYIVWLDAKRVAHLSNECEEFQGKWSLTSAADANEHERAGCAACEADRYLAAIAEGREPTVETPAPAVTPEPTAEPTAEPTEKPTEAPTEEPTEAPTEEPTEEPVPEATEVPATETAAEVSASAVVTEKITEAPTAEPTQAATEVPASVKLEAELSAALLEAMATEEPTPEPTEEPTEAPTEIPTEAPTEAPTKAPTEVPTQAPTPEPTPAPAEIADGITVIQLDVPVMEIVMVTPTPTAANASVPAVPDAFVQAITPTVTLKPAAEATVYHSSNGKWYHTFNRCSGMTGGGAYPLAECVDNFLCCPVCGAPQAEMIGRMCLWQDVKGICHTADTCAAFDGQYALVLREDALERSLPACSDCGADQYLVPGTTVQLPEVTPGPAA